MALSQSIIGTSFYSGGGSPPLGRMYWNNVSKHYAYAEGSPGSWSYHSYDFPNNTTSNTLEFNSGGFESTPNLGAVNDFWLDFWIYPTSLGIAILTEMDYGYSPGYLYNMVEIDNDGHIYAGTWDGGTIQRVVSTDKVTVNAWNHIFFYYYDGTLHLEVNGGSPVELGGVTRGPPSSTYLAVGFNCATAMFTSNTYRGYIEPIYGSTTSVASRYNSTKSKYQAQPAFALQGSSYGGSGPWIDSVASKSFTLHNSPTWSSTNGGQFRFDAASYQWGDTGGAGTSLPDLPSFTVQGVFKLHSMPEATFPCLITEDWPGTGTKINYTLGFINNQTDFAGGFFQADGGFWIPNTLVAKSGPVLDTWYDIVCSFYGPTKELKIYLDGILVDTITTVGSAGTDNAGIRIARRWDSEDYLDCTIKDINIWNGVLTPSEITNQHVPYNSLV